MTSRTFVRRAFLAGVLLPTPLSAVILVDAEANGGVSVYPGSHVPSVSHAAVAVRQPMAVDGYGRPVVLPPVSRSGIQPVQYQPGQQPAGNHQSPVNSQYTAPQQPGNSAVVNELNRLFIENGQQPPSMRTQDLPYANAPIPNTVRPREQAAPKPNMLQRFVGRLRGEPRQTPSAPAASTAVPAANGSALSSQSAPPPGGRPATATVNRPPQVPPSEMSAPANAGLRNRPPVPFNGQAGQAVQAAQAGQAGQAGQAQQRAYVQPGPAPAFMQPHAAGQRVNAPVQQRPLPAVPVTQSQVAAGSSSAAIPAPNDGFTSPFADSDRVGVTRVHDADEVLDLDSLIEIPSPANLPAAVPGMDVATQQAPAAAAAVGSAGQERVQDSETMASPVTENPFTGVKLDVSDEEFFDANVGRATVSDLPDTEMDDRLPPVEEFSSDLPALPSATDDPNIGIPAAGAGRTAVESGRPAAAPLVQPGVIVRPAETKNQQGNQPVDSERIEVARERNRRDEQRAMIAARSSQTGFKGFCPVELRDRRELADADPGFRATFGLRTYTFSSQQAKLAFESDPSRYAAAAGGSDVVLLVNSGEEQPGMLDYSLWYRDRLYMFRSRETMSLFAKDPARFANQY